MERENGGVDAGHPGAPLDVAQVHRWALQRVQELESLLAHPVERGSTRELVTMLRATPSHIRASFPVLMQVITAAIARPSTLGTATEHVVKMVQWERERHQAIAESTRNRDSELLQLRGA